MNILYVEDDRGLWTLVRHALKDLAVDLTGAHSLAEACEIVKSQHFSLAIVDHELPDGKGLDFVIKHSDQLPCIMLTGVGNEELVVTSMLQGAKDYIVKDVHGRYLERLPRIIKRVEREIQLEEENQQKKFELNNARQQLKIVFDAAPDLMIITDDNCRILHMSKAACVEYDISPDEYIGATLDTLIPSDALEQLFSKCNSNSENKFETRLVDKFDVIASHQSLKDDICLVVFRNQAEKIRASKAIAQAEAVKIENERLQELNQELVLNIKRKNNTKIIGNSPPIQELLTYIENVADTEATVLVLGETGTGKELIADEIHYQSHRKDEAIIKLNCAAIPTELIESELFGYESGAFTGAKSSHEGRFSQADKGTLFLDEIGELDFKLQSKLLRVLQEGEIMPLGSKAPREIDVRVIAATNRDLEEMVQQGIFRADLYYRLNVVPLYAPPLRDRTEDIPLLAAYFYQKFKDRYKTKKNILSDSHIEILTKRNWPGNVRELQNIIERFVVLGKIDQTYETKKEISIAEPLDAAFQDSIPLSVVEKAHILQVLDRCQWIISGPKGAASTLGLNPSTLRFRMQKLGISRKEHQSSSNSG